MHTGVTGSSLVLLKPILTTKTEQLQLHAGHIIHHSSMDYNISVGVRGGAFDIAHVREIHATVLQPKELQPQRNHHAALPTCAMQFGWICYLPLAFVCPPGMYLAHRTSNFVYSVSACGLAKHMKAALNVLCCNIVLG